MDSISIVLIFAAGAAVGIVLLSLVVLLAYRVATKKKIVKQQVVGVIAWITVIQCAVAVSAYLDDRNGNYAPTSTVFLVGYLIAIFGGGVFIASKLRQKA